MSEAGLGVALHCLRMSRTLSVREVGKLSEIDHAYIHRLESGEKTNPSPELVSKLIKTLKASERDGQIIEWLVGHPEANPELVQYVLDDPSIELDVFTMAAGARHRGSKRPAPATLIDRVRRALYTEDDD